MLSHQGSGERTLSRDWKVVLQFACAIDDVARAAVELGSCRGRQVGETSERELHMSLSSLTHYHLRIGLSLCELAAEAVEPLRVLRDPRMDCWRT